MAKKQFDLTPEQYKRADEILSDGKYNSLISKDLSDSAAYNAFFDEIPEEDRGVISLFMAHALDIQIYNYMTKLPDGFFNNWPIFPKIVLGSNVEEIDQNTFMGSNFSTIDLSKSSITKIPSEAFSALAMTEEVILPDEDLEEIGDRAFNDCPALKRIRIPAKSLDSLQPELFEGCNENLIISVDGNEMTLKDIFSIGA